VRKPVVQVEAFPKAPLPAKRPLPPPQPTKLEAKGKNNQVKSGKLNFLPIDKSLQPEVKKETKIPEKKPTSRSVDVEVETKKEGKKPAKKTASLTFKKEDTDEGEGKELGTGQKTCFNCSDMVSR
jgi:hypothetical protein